MNRDSINWWGPMPAVVTPFDDDGAIDARAMQETAERLFADGATGLLVGGCTGEFWALNFDERCELFALGARLGQDRGGNPETDRSGRSSGLRWRPDTAALFYSPQ
jgi:4-hydroxy-tetrahydrodipicolinate synthase